MFAAVVLRCHSDLNGKVEARLFGLALEEKWVCLINILLAHVSFSRIISCGEMKRAESEAVLTGEYWETFYLVAVK